MVLPKGWAALNLYSSRSRSSFLLPWFLSRFFFLLFFSSLPISSVPLFRCVSTRPVLYSLSSCVLFERTLSLSFFLSFFLDFLFLPLVSRQQTRRNSDPIVCFTSYTSDIFSSGKISTIGGRHVCHVGTRRNSIESRISRPRTAF